MPETLGDLAIQIRRLLDRLVTSRGLTSDEQEEVHDEVAEEAYALPRKGVLEALDAAIGSNEARQRESVYILSQLTDVPEVVRRIGTMLEHTDAELRSWLIQTIAHAGLKQHASLLNEIIETDTDAFCRRNAIHAAGRLKATENLPVLLRLAEEAQESDIWPLACALQEYATEACRPTLKKWFDDRRLDSQTRVIAAWGLGKLGDADAVAFLIRLLEDLHRRGTHSVVSLRAAQALCHIKQWPFQWHTSFVAKTIAMLKDAESRDPPP